MPHELSSPETNSIYIYTTYTMTLSSSSILIQNAGGSITPVSAFLDYTIIPAVNCPISVKSR